MTRRRTRQLSPRLAGEREPLRLRPGPCGSERGAALVTALLVLLVLAVLATGLLNGITLERKITAHATRGLEALSAAEGGIGEALARIRSGEIPDTLNPRMVAQIFLAGPGALPALGADSIALATAQVTGRWLAYSAPERGPDVLTVSYRTDPTRTRIYRYDPTRSPMIQTASGTPVFLITSTGRRGNDRRTIVTECARSPVRANLKAALAADCPSLVLEGLSNMACGHDHRADTPTWTGSAGSRRTGAGGCAAHPGIGHWELGTAPLAGVWNTGAIKTSKGGLCAGSPLGSLSDQTGFYAGPWEVLGVSAAEFYAWIGPRRSSVPLNPRGPLHVDDNGVAQDRAGSFKSNGGSGEGFLYVDGDLDVKRDLSFRGVVYVEGELDLDKDAKLWVLGALIVRGKAGGTLKLKGHEVVLLSRDAIQRSLDTSASPFVTLSWREP